MAHIPPQPLVDFARRLLQHEAGKAGSVNELGTGLQRVCRALHERLAPLISSAGFQTLFARAIKLAGRDFPFLATVSVHTNSGCTLSGLPRRDDAHRPEDVADALTAVLAHFIWLLVIFIGENLGLSKVREVWPEVPFGGVVSSSRAEE